MNSVHRLRRRPARRFHVPSLPTQLWLRAAAGHLLLSVFCLSAALAVPPASQTASVVSGYTSPATLNFRQGPATLSDDFNSTTLDTCHWRQDSGGGYTSLLDGSTFTVTGSGSDPNSFSGVSLQTIDSFPAGTFSAQLEISAATATQYRVSLTAKDGSQGSGTGSLDASVGVNSNGDFFLDISYREGNSTIAQSSGSVFSGSHSNPIPYNLRLSFDATSNTASATFLSRAGNSTQTINVTPSFTTFKLRPQLSSFDSGSVSMNSFTSDVTQGTKYEISSSPLSVFGIDYHNVPFTQPPSDGVIVITTGDPVLVNADDTCVALDGTADLSAALATFGPYHVTIFTTLPQSAINGLAQGNGGVLDCFGTGFTNNGAGNDYTFAPPECMAPADTPTPGANTATPTTAPNTPTTAPNTPTTAPNTPTTVPNTPTAPPATATATNAPATATATIPPADTPTATATVPPAAFEINSAVLNRGRDRSPRDNGSVSVRARVVDEAGNLAERVAAGGFSLEVEDGDGSFHVSFPFASCAQLSNGNTICRTKDPIKSVIKVNAGDEAGQFELRVQASGFPNSATGPTGSGSNPTEAPVTVTLHEGGSQTDATITTCRASGLTKLTCRD